MRSRSLNLQTSLKLRLKVQNETGTVKTRVVIERAENAVCRLSDQPLILNSIGALFINMPQLSLGYLRNMKTKFKFKFKFIFIQQQNIVYKYKIFKYNNYSMLYKSKKNPKSFLNVVKDTEINPKVFEPSALLIET